MDRETELILGKLNDITAALQRIARALEESNKQNVFNSPAPRTTVTWQDSLIKRGE